MPVETIDYITADGAYAEIHVGDKSFVIRERMQTVKDRLDPARFFRIHCSAIVRLKGGTRLRVSRSRRDELEQRLSISL